MEGDKPLLNDVRPEPSKGDIEANTRIIYKKKKRKCGCCRSLCCCCCKFWCILIAVLFFLICLSFIVPSLRDAFAPVKTDVNWSVPHTFDQEDKMRNTVDRINNQLTSSGKKRTWKARYNPFGHWDSNNNIFHWNRNNFEVNKEKAVDGVELALHTVKNGLWMGEDLMGDTIEHIRELIMANLPLPSSFDTRERWPRCSSVHQISNQGACGSCWAMAAVSVMSDRLCISSNYSRQESISAQDLMSCCPSCGSCGGGGFLISAFNQWKGRGLVTGGSYGSNEGCRPYQIDNKCGYPCALGYYTKDRTPRCESQCQPLYSKSYTEDLIKSRKAYWLRSSVDDYDEDSLDWRVREQRKINQAIYKEFVEANLTGTVDHYSTSQHKGDYMIDAVKRELLLHGPVMGCLLIHEEFLVYDSGIYKWDDGTYLYSHCMKLIGWGEEGGIKYWTYANSWGRNWGENGFIRINMEDGLPSDIAAGIF